MVDFFSKRLNLRNELSVLVKSSGFKWVALRAAQLDQPCNQCIIRAGELYETTPSTCMKCLNTGYLFVDKLVRGYSYLTAAGRDFLSSVGNINTDLVIYIIEHNTRAKEGDYICELDIDESTETPRQPFKIIRTFKIQDSMDIRCDDGRIEYLKNYCEEYNFDKGINIW